VTERERVIAEQLVEVHEVGDWSLATELAINLLEAGPVVGDTRCGCGLWPGQQWQCRPCSVREARRAG
jgi:hypothetical protein